MGVIKFHAFVWLAVLPQLSVQIQLNNLCNKLNFCNCTINDPSSKVVNCIFPRNEVVNFTQTAISKNMSEIHISGGKELTFAEKTFNSLPRLTVITIKGSGKILMDKKSFYDILSSNLLIKVLDCFELIIKTSAFRVESSLTLEFSEISKLTIEAMAFNKISNSVLEHIKECFLEKNSFHMVDQEHVESIPIGVAVFQNVSLKEIPPEVFSTSMAEISFNNSKIGIIHKNAFNALEISYLLMNGVMVEQIQTGAFSDNSHVGHMKLFQSHLCSFEADAVLAACDKFTISQSLITDIEQRSINITVAEVEVTANLIIGSLGFDFKGWNRINMNNNKFRLVHPNFLKVSNDMTNENFNFRLNEICTTGKADELGMSENNLFNETCNSFDNDWLKIVTTYPKNEIWTMNSRFCRKTELQWINADRGSKEVKKSAVNYVPDIVKYVIGAFVCAVALIAIFAIFVIFAILNNGDMDDMRILEQLGP